MKEYFFIAFVFITQFSFGQDTIVPPSLNFTGLDVNWVHLAEDPNFIGDFESTNVTKYSSGVTRALKSNKDYVYIFNQSINHYGDFDGFDLYKLDVQTGDLLNSLNFDSYTESRYYYIFGFGSNFILNENSELILLGYRSINNYVPSDPYTFPVFSFFGKPIKFNIDQEELVVLDTIVGVNENMDPGFRYNFISAISGDLIRDKSGNYIHISKGNIIEDNFAKM